MADRVDDRLNFLRRRLLGVVVEQPAEQHRLVDDHAAHEARVHRRQLQRDCGPVRMADDVSATGLSQQRGDERGFVGERQR